MTKMTTIHENYALDNNTTFGVEAHCNYYAEPNSEDELLQIIKLAQNKKWNTFIIGEGSNLLFTNSYNGLILKPSMKGITVQSENNDECILRVGAGENWDKFVEWCVNHNLYGTENLSHIPGSVGAAPVQNIGAYGREAKDVIEKVEALNTETMKFVSFNNTSCKFAYRDSIFKQHKPGKFIVCYVTFRLQKNAALLLDYGKVKEEFLKETTQDLAALRNTIIKIRSSKLPDPDKIGNGGSYFKNPVIPKKQFEELKIQHPEIPNYPTGEGKIKIPAAWLIDQSGWKGIREGQTGTWPSQPLVIVNYGSATGSEILKFSEKIRLDIKSKFNISLHREVLIIP